MSSRQRRAARRVARQRGLSIKRLRRHARRSRVGAAALAAGVAALGVACSGPTAEPRQEPLEESGPASTGAMPSSTSALPSSHTSALPSRAGGSCDVASRGSTPQELIAMGASLFFTADDGSQGRGLWKSDGTEAGTVMVKDFGGDTFPSSRYYPAVVGKTLFFVGPDAGGGGELWQSDGTRSGTVMVKDIQPTGVYGGPAHLTAVGETLFMAADDGRHGIELWKSDGTRSGTVMVKDIGPGKQGFDYEYYYGPEELTARGGTLFFTAFDRVHGRSVWRSDGTDAGTRHREGRQRGQAVQVGRTHFRQPRRGRRAGLLRLRGRPVEVGRNGGRHAAPRGPCSADSRPELRGDGRDDVLHRRRPRPRGRAVEARRRRGRGRDGQGDPARLERLRPGVLDGGRAHGCSSMPTMVFMAGSCGGRTAPRRAP